MAFFSNLVHALTSPVNCAANYGSAVLGATAQFVSCVATNLTNF